MRFETMMMTFNTLDTIAWSSLLALTMYLDRPLRNEIRNKGRAKLVIGTDRQRIAFAKKWGER